MTDISKYKNVSLSKDTYEFITACIDYNDNNASNLSRARFDIWRKYYIRVCDYSVSFVNKQLQIKKIELSAKNDVKIEESDADSDDMNSWQKLLDDAKKGVECLIGEYVDSVENTFTDIELEQLSDKVINNISTLLGGQLRK